MRKGKNQKYHLGKVVLNKTIPVIKSANDSINNPEIVFFNVFSIPTSFRLDKILYPRINRKSHSQQRKYNCENGEFQFKPMINFYAAEYPDKEYGDHLKSQV
jgi:hypothetical protein